MKNPNEVSELLVKLHGALANTPTLSAHDRELLRQLASDIQAVLAQPDAQGGEGSGSLAARLADAVTRFEVTHPDLTGVLASVSKSLGDMGI